MSAKTHDSEQELSKNERELILRALSYYQIYLFDEMKKKAFPDAALDQDYKKSTLVIKKIHKSIEKHA
jgi:hypothetical protein